MYQNKMAIAIKANNRVLRENGEQVYLPFGSEYSLLIKNLHTRRALVHIQIDGKDVTNGGLVVPANSSVDLERFITDNLESGNKFKFIERTTKIEEHRGVGVEDGLVRVEFEYEREYAKHNWFDGIDWKINWNSPPVSKGADAIADKWLNTGTYDPTQMQEDYYFACTDSGRGFSGNVCASASSTSYTPEIVTNQVKNEAGITVPGSISEQKFVNTHIQTDGIKHVMVMRLVGETETGKVEAPITVKDRKIFHIDTGNLPPAKAKEYLEKIKKELAEKNLEQAKCTTCNHQNAITAKFCCECGTGLIIV